MKYHLSEHVSFTKVDDEAVLLDLNTGTYFGLNQVGTDFLNIVQTTNVDNHIEHATQQIAALYQTSEDQVRADLMELVEQLQENALLCECV